MSTNTGGQVGGDIRANPVVLTSRRMEALERVAEAAQDLISSVDDEGLTVPYMLDKWVRHLRTVLDLLPQKEAE